ncbi:MAG: serine/threonine protein kinase [Planctomycetes bacterium]|nr:serine/threonine protein kinase [Planctomycetota bacterium]
MSDLKANLGPGETRRNHGKQGSSVKVRNPVPEQVLPTADAEPTDDQPTVVSKTSPIQAGRPLTAGALSQGLKGRTLAHYELLEPIGVGGMAAVLQARDQQLDRLVALKILPPEMAGDPENIRRFHQEARAAAKLDHENIARVFFCGEDQDLHFIAFEFVEGDNLRMILERRGRLPVGEAVRYVLQIATGLEHAASRSVVHRDIKPSNIIITPTGRAKLVDMGLARSQTPQDDKALTQSGVTLGTFDYISPEQALEPREADVRSDIYSLGCTFYHMLTGQPPVPGGTAAKKLHHHQHVDPLDPRQLNPEIPDDVAAILARMMAKDPNHRYQQPVQLIQHLLQVAQHVGAADAPEGMLFIDAPLPSAPRRRPILTATAAALGLALVLFVLSLLPPSTRPVSPPPQLAENVIPPSKGKGEVAKKSVEPPLAEGTIRIKDAKDLARLRQALERNEAPQVRAIIDVPFLDVSETPLVVNGNELILESGDPKVPAKIRFQYQPAEGEAATSAAVWVESGQLHCKNLLFEVKSAVTPETLVAAIAVGRAGKALLERCAFVQRDFPKQKLISLPGKYTPLASLALANTKRSPQDRPRIDAAECYFETGQDAIALNGPGDLFLNNCAFGPHNALVHLRGKHDYVESMVSWKNCSALVVNGPAFRLDDNAACQLMLSYSIFSTPADEPRNLRDDDRAFIRQTEAREPAVRLTGRRNCFHNFEVLCAWPQENGIALVTQADDFRKWVSKAGGTLDTTTEPSVFLAGNVNPWRSAKPLEEIEWRFEVSDTRPEVRRDRDTPLGMLTSWWGKMPKLLALPEAKLARDLGLQPNEKLVDPDLTGVVPGVYKNLSKALEDAIPGDVILLKPGKDRREIAIKPSMLAQAKIDLTLRPYKKYNPILILDETPEPDAAMFKLYDGKLTLENLEVLLQPAQPGFRSLSVVTLYGNGRCTFKQCVFTLKDDNIPLRVVTLENPENAMKMSAKVPRSTPELRFQDCFIRGDGDLVKILVSRPLELSVDNSILTLTGSLAAIAGNPKETTLESPASIKLNRVSAFLAKSLVQLRALASGKGIAPTRLDARDCLFVAMNGKPLIYLDRLDVEDSRLRDAFNWTGSHNAFSGFRYFLDQQRPEEVIPLPPLRYDEKAWRMHTMEADSKFLQARFDFSASRPMSQSVLDDCRPKTEWRTELQNYGANLDSIPLPPMAPAAETDESR